MKLLFFSLWTKIWQILHQSSVPSNITPLWLFSSKIIYFDQKELIKVQILDIFECSGQNLSNSLCQFWNDKSRPSPFLRHSLLSWQITPLQILSSHVFYFRSKNPNKVPIGRLSSALVKILQVPHVIFESKSQFSFKICINIKCHQT